MYIFKNAWINIKRNKGRNILIGIIITVITASSCIALAINKSGNLLVDSYKNSNPLEISFSLDQQQLRSLDDNAKNNFIMLTVDDIEKYGDSTLVSDYYYYKETSLSSNDIDPVSLENFFNDDKPDDDNNLTAKDGQKNDMKNGDFRITGYSDPAYITSFVNGTTKIKDGSMFAKDSKEDVAIISEALAEENELAVGDKITFYSTNDSEKEIELEIVGIFENTTDDSENNFMGMNMMNSDNQIYTTYNVINSIVANDSDERNFHNLINVKYYLEDNNNLAAFETEVRDKGLADYYTIITNEDEITSTLNPIKNIGNFSITFLIVILIVGSIILAIIHMINIRERKYEIGVLRAIGMSKFKVTCQLLIEIFIISIISLVLGTGIGILTAQPVTNKMLSQEINNLKNQQISQAENFGGQGFERRAFRPNESMDNTNYVDSLTVKIDLLTIGQLFLVTIFLTAVSGTVAIMFVNKYEPNKILQNR
ncbi:MAG: ABC transporter permease [Bacilli bacterium]